MNKLLGDGPSTQALQQMRDRGGRWACYQNVALDSADHGRLQFLKIGPDCTHTQPPAHMPDTHVGLGWKYLFCGYVNLETGQVEE